MVTIKHADPIHETGFPLLSFIMIRCLKFRTQSRKFKRVSLNATKHLISTKGIESLSLWFSNLYIFVIQCRRPLIFQTMNSVRWKNLSLKYQRITPSGGKNIGIRKSELVTKTQFLCITHSQNPGSDTGFHDNTLSYISG